MIKEYVIFSSSEINKINFDEVLEDSIETLRKSLDETETFVTWVGTMPQSVDSLTTKSSVYYHDEMFDILNTPQWNLRPIQG